jgi:hypothetical protein
MKHLAIAVTVLLITATLGCDISHAQARGPSVIETLKNQQTIGNFKPGERLIPHEGMLIPESVLRKGPEAVQTYISSLSPLVPVLDDATRKEKLSEQEAWLRRLPGRFRIDGRIAMPWTLQKSVSGEALLSARISGVADCVAVGEGVGVQCLINASWPPLETDVHEFEVPDQALNISEAVNSLQPAMLVLGLDVDKPGVRAHMVTDESIATTWTGVVNDDNFRTIDKSDCSSIVWGVVEYRCGAFLNVFAEPDSESVTIELVWRPRLAAWATLYRSESEAPDYDESKTPLRDLHVKLVMYRDADAEAPIPTKKAR